VKVKKGIVDKQIGSEINVHIPCDRNVFIYLYSHPSTGKPMYVGKTVNIKVRGKQHLFDAKKGKRKTKFNLWLNNHKEAEPVIIEICNIINWEDREKYWIDYYRNLNDNLLNTLDGGEGFNRVKHNSDYNKKLSDAAKLKYERNPYLRENIVERLGKIERRQLPDVFIDYHERNIPISELSQKYNISRSSLAGILSGRRYKHLTGFLLYKYGKIKRRRKKKNTVENICRKYLDGCSVEDLALEFKCRRATILVNIKIGTGKTYQKHEKERLRNKILSLYRNGGLSNKEIAKIVGVCLPYVYKVTNKRKRSDGEN
jgi:AraC-like DNA-binding protein